MPLLGRITNLLHQGYIDAGFRLTEDEDFLYLYEEPKISPIKVFSSHGAEISRVESYIEEHIRKQLGD